jgi:hypothetical protein
MDEIIPTVESMSQDNEIKKTAKVKLERKEKEEI